MKPDVRDIGAWLKAQRVYHAARAQEYAARCIAEAALDSATLESFALESDHGSAFSLQEAQRAAEASLEWLARATERRQHASKAAGAALLKARGLSDG